MGNYFNGNNALGSAVYPAATNRLVPDGFVWDQAGGNIYVGRNTMVNHWFEAVQLDAGPNAVSGNTISNAVVYPSACALRNSELTWPGADGMNNGNYPTTFVGNWVCGEYTGTLSGIDPSSYAQVDTNTGVPVRRPNIIYVAGNYFNFPGASSIAYPGTNGAPGEAVETEICTTVTISGNKLASGSYGLFFSDACTNALILNNDFSGATFGGVGAGRQNDIPRMANARIIGNNIAAGVTFHVQLPPQLTNTYNWFLYGNRYLNTASNPVASFFDPTSSGAHVSN